MCVYCEKSKSLLEVGSSEEPMREVYIEQDATMTVNTGVDKFPEDHDDLSQYEYNFNINFCPMCGRQLR